MVLPELREASLISFVRALPRAFAKAPYARSSEEAAPPREASLPLESLSEQEQQVLRLLVIGCSKPEFARELVISINTMKTHIQGLYRKRNVHNRIEANKVARRLAFL